MARNSLTKSDCNILFNQIIYFIKSSEDKFFKLKKLRGAMGYCMWENGIFLDYRNELVPTLIHECIHYLNPDWCESQVLYAEKRVINSITSEQVIKLLKTFIVLL